MVMTDTLQRGQPPLEDVHADIDFLLLSADVASIRRFHGQPFWEEEGAASDRAIDLEQGLRLESVADHSWKVADAAFLLADHYPHLDRSRCLELALLHDKLELLTGDWSPIDADASGSSTHAFDPRQAARKATAEREALDILLVSVRPTARARHRTLFLEVIDRSSEEARFVAAVDKLASLIFVLQKKRTLHPRHLEFTLHYGAKSLDMFPLLAPYYHRLVALLEEKYKLGASLCACAED